MKWVLLFLIIIITLLGGAAFLVAPYHIYTTAITEGVDTSFLKLSPTRNELYDGGEFILEESERTKFINTTIFKKIHINNFELYLPIDNPAVVFIPEIKLESNVHKVGFELLDQKNNFLFKFIVERPYKFKTIHGDQKLFLLPIYQHFIQQKDEKKLWGDLFYKKLSLPSNEGKSFLESLKELRSIKYEELVYNLFILYNRHNFFIDDVEKIRLLKETNIGMGNLVRSDEKIIRERIYYLENGVVYPITITTNQSILMAQSFRTLFINNLKFKISKQDSAIALSSESKRFSFQNRTDQKGMIYLFSAWTHDFKNKDFLTVIINFLERGNANIKYLKPFYEFAYKQFGTSLSQDKNFKLETAEERIKRETQEELDKEILEANKSKSSVDKVTEDPNELIDLNLKKAKELKIDSDDKKQNLSIE